LKIKVLIFISVSLFLISLLYLAHPFLAYNHPVKSKVLVIEGWLPDFALEQAVAEFEKNNYQLAITTGGPLPEFLEMSSGGYLIFELDSAGIIIDSAQAISIRNYGSKADTTYAHFTVFADEQLIGDSYSSSKVRETVFYLPTGRAIRQLIIHYDNDAVLNGEDRNLYIHSITLGSETFLARAPNVWYDYGKLDGVNRRETCYLTIAEDCADRLQRMGLDKHMIVAAPAPSVTRHKTYASAVAVKNWLDASGLNVESICIFSLGTHARRTHLSYKKAFGRTMDIGILAGESKKYNAQQWWTSKKGIQAVMRELFSYFYTIVFV
jgi:hypothetical protein